MPRILTVDDSRAIRSILKKHINDFGLGIEMDEAEDGVQGLAKLGAGSYDLVLLDVTMPVMDGPGMLAKMRAQGIATPVLMLTSESKSSIVATVMRLGIDDYIMKPFREDELRAKIMKALKLAATAVPVADTPTDVLVVDDIDSVAKKLRSLLSEQITMESCLSAADATAMCRVRKFRVVFVKLNLPGMDTGVLVSQLRKLQPEAAYYALGVTSPTVDREAAAKGFVGVLRKPFDAGAVDAVVANHFGHALIGVKENVLTVAPCSATDPDRVGQYFKRVGGLLDEALQKVAAACFDDAVLDLGKVPPRADRLPKFVLAARQRAAEMSLTLRLVGSEEMRKILQSFTDTAEVPFFDTVAAAAAKPAAG